MIRVKCVGHIGTAMGKEELELNVEEVQVDDLIDRLRKLSKEQHRVGFNRFNTLVMVEDGEAFVAATRSRLIKNGESVVLIPFSHGG